MIELPDFIIEKLKISDSKKEEILKELQEESIDRLFLLEDISFVVKSKELKTLLERQGK